MQAIINTKEVERWSVFEAICEGHQAGNPFIDYEIQAVFENKNEVKTVEGFYDGEGRYIVRFMPSFTGAYRYKISGSFSDTVFEGSFTAVPATGDNHGPVRVYNKFHFAYEDGTPYYCFGTTCYNWAHQTDELKSQTMKTLSETSFNKMRYCIFPKHYVYNFNDPKLFPFPGKPCHIEGMNEYNVYRYFGNKEGNEWDFTRFNPAFFRNLEKSIITLMEAGIEADLIMMHTYDRWGFSRMEPEVDDRYIRYIVARFAAYRNVWWSLANEYDLLRHKTLEDWERYAAILCDRDPYMHLRSIHNATVFYDYSRPWITHCSIQRVDIYKTTEYTNDWRVQYQKPVVLDEIGYEGNLTQSWGNISGKELTRRFWEGALRGGYPGHSETYLHPEEIIWWSHGGRLHGESHSRIQFLQKIVEETPGHGLRWLPNGFGQLIATTESMGIEMPGDKDYYLYYFGLQRPSYFDIFRNEGKAYQVELIDTWEMTVKDCGVQAGKIHIDMPGKEYMAIRLKKIE